MVRLATIGYERSYRKLSGELEGCEGIRLQAVYSRRYGKGKAFAGKHG